MFRNFLQTLRNMMVSNRELKLLACLLAVVSFHLIRQVTSDERPYMNDVDVLLEKVEGLALIHQDPRAVEVTFRGSREDLDKLESARPRVVLHPRAADRAESEEIEITERHVTDVPSGVRVARIRPGLVTVQFDRETTKEVAVIKPKIVGQPLRGRAELDYEPKTVRIRGSRRRLRDTTALETEPVEVDGRVESFVKRVRVLQPGDDWWSAIEPDSVTTKVTIVTENVSREWSDVPVVALMPPQDVCTVTLDPPMVAVSLYGHAEWLETMTPERLKVFVDVSNLNPAKEHKMPVRVYLPEGMDVTTQVKPETVNVRLRVREPSVQKGPSTESEKRRADE